MSFPSMSRASTDLLRTIRQEFPKSISPVNSQSAVHYDYTQPVDRMDTVYMHRPSRLDKLSAGTEAVTQDFRYHQFPTTLRLKEDLKTILDRGGKKQKENLYSSGSGANITDVMIDEIQTVYKVLPDKKAIVVQNTRIPVSSDNERLERNDEARRLLEAASESGRTKLPPHTNHELTEAAQLAVVLGKPNLIYKLIKMTGKTPPPTQVSRLLYLAKDNKNTKRGLQNIFQNFYQRELSESPTGLPLVKALTTLSRVNIPLASDLKRALKRQEDAKRSGSSKVKEKEIREDHFLPLVNFFKGLQNKRVVGTLHRLREGKPTANTDVVELVRYNKFYNPRPKKK